MANVSLKSLPGILREIAEVAGVDAALAVSRVKGGMDVVFPSRGALRQERHRWLIDAVGMQSAEKIADIFPMPMKLIVPIGPNRRVSRDRTIAEMSARGVSASAVAKEIGCHVRTVFRVREKLRREAKPLKRKQSCALATPRNSLS